MLGQREFNPAGFHRPPYRAAPAPSQIGYGPDAIRTKRIDASGRPIERDGVQQPLHLPRALIGDSHHDRHRTQHQMRLHQPLPGIYRRPKRHLRKCHHPAKLLASGDSRADRFSVAGDATNASIAAATLWHRLGTWITCSQ